MLVGSWIICVGLNACSMATDEHCSVALGANVQFPAHAGHVLVTPELTQPLGYLNDRIVDAINAAAARAGGRPLSAEYVRAWNAACTVLGGKPGV